ncbi:hypothetical protein BURKHO8Y_240291 [Burkholderia sp. 8Y]|nr:hypothetical protein BURKHO8Y_240291 [Burkholderia sp. 8Y]
MSPFYDSEVADRHMPWLLGAWLRRTQPVCRSKCDARSRRCSVKRPRAVLNYRRTVLCLVYGRDAAGNEQGLPVMVVCPACQPVAVPARPLRGSEGRGF